MEREWWDEILFRGSEMRHIFFLSALYCIFFVGLTITTYIPHAFYEWHLDPGLWAHSVRQSFAWMWSLKQMVLSMIFLVKYIDRAYSL